MAAPASPLHPLAAIAAALLLLLVAAPSAAAAASPVFPGVPPLQLQALQQRRPASSAGGSRYVVAAAAAAAGGNGTAAAAKPFTAHYFPQELDHFTFTPNASAVFYQKYLVNDTFWRRSAAAGETPAGPIFVYTGNEGDIEWFATNTGFMFDIAPSFGALLHRFYGESKPFGNESNSSPEKLGYLTSTQALADFAVLITSLKHNLSAVSSPVVVFGGSYGGMLASWFRLKYPHVTIGAVASSAPILQTVKSVYSFRNWLWTAFVYTAMVDYPTPANFLMNLPAYPIKEMCKIIDGFPAGADIVDKAFAAASLYYNYTGDQACFQLEDGEDPHGLSGWGWQACTEMVMPMTISNESMFPPFTFTYEGKSDDCFQSYGVRPRPHWITTEYGGNRIDLVLKRFGSNIIFSNGMRDPWSRGGVLKNISSSIIALVTEKGAHHLDFRSATKDDPDWVVEQRRQEVKIIQGWIDQYNEDLAQISK
uniref:Lysosomal Pro-X carboxypeptidase n=1 Tax=Oryza nivara TaxID=4536 RepID=A0A0E0HU62_ORYNI